RDLLALHLGYVEDVLTPLSPVIAAGHHLHVRVVVGGGVPVADLRLPVLRVARLADQLVEQREYVLVHQARVAERAAARGRTRAGTGAGTGAGRRARAGRAAGRRGGARG